MGGSVPILKFASFLFGTLWECGNQKGHYQLLESSVVLSAQPGLAAVQNIQRWTRTRFKLAMDAPVLVAEVTCTMPLCPPLETAVAFWTEDEKRHQFKLYKPMAEVVYDDIGWLMGSPADHDGLSWDCC